MSAGASMSQQPESVANTMDDPVRLIGAGVLGAFGQYLFAKLRKVRSTGNGHAAVAEIHEMRQEIKAMHRRLDERMSGVEGTVRGIHQRLEAGGL